MEVVRQILVTMGFNVIPGARIRMSVEEFSKWINNMDRDGDGVISKIELEKSIGALGFWFPGWKTKKAFAAVDSNDNGLIDTDEELKALIDFAQKHWGMDIDEN